MMASNSWTLSSVAFAILPGVGSSVSLSTDRHCLSSCLSLSYLSRARYKARYVHRSCLVQCCADRSRGLSDSFDVVDHIDEGDLKDLKDESGDYHGNSGAPDSGTARQWHQAEWDYPAEAGGADISTDEGWEPWMTGNLTEDENAQLNVLFSDDSSDTLAESQSPKGGNDIDSAHNAQILPLEMDPVLINAQLTNHSRGARIDPTEGLNEGQAVAYFAASEGQNLFITGGAGTGKSFVLSRIVEEISLEYGEDAVGVTALTGVAAEILGGCTLHSLLGIPGTSDKKKLLAAVRSMQNSKRNARRTAIQKLRTLVIDEISMASGELLDVVSMVLQAARDSDLPFGGIQKNKKRYRDALLLNRSLAFESKSWMMGSIATVILDQAERQSDPWFIKALDDLRHGMKTSLVASLITKASRPLPVTANGPGATRLFANNSKVEKYNQDVLESLPGEEETFQATDRIYLPESFFKKLQKIEEKLEKLESQVGDEVRSSVKKQHEQQVAEGKQMLTLLQNSGLFRQFRSGETLALRKGAQVMALRNNWNAELEAFTYVNGSQGIVSGFCEYSGSPIVEFENGMKETVKPAVFRMGLPGIGTCYRLQIPLVLSWAITMHKSQGKTISKLVVDVSNIFQRGQLYVALSRARSLEGLEISPAHKKIDDLYIYPQYRVENFFKDVRAGEFVRTKLWQEIHEAYMDSCEKELTENELKLREQENMKKEKQKAKKEKEKVKKEKAKKKAEGGTAQKAQKRLGTKKAKDAAMKDGERV